MQDHQHSTTSQASAGNWSGIGIPLACCFLLLLAFSFVRVPVPGINEPHYLSKAKAFADPTWCERDMFLQSANAHYVFFVLTGPFTQVLPLPAVAIVGRVCSLLLLACGWVALARQLRLTAAATVLAAALWCGISLTGNLSGEWVIGGYEGKVPSYGFALLGSAGWLAAFRQRSARRYVAAGLCFGAAISLHPVVGAWFCVAIAAVEIVLHLRPPIGCQNRSLTTFIGHGMVFVLSSTLLALPGLIPAVAMLLESELPRKQVDQANYIQVFWRLKHHLDPTEFSLYAWLHSLVLLLVAGMTHLWIRSRMHRGMGDTQSEDAAGRESDVHLAAAIAWKQWWVLLLVAGVIVAVGAAIGWHSKPILQTEGWQWRAALLKFYPFRLFDALLPMTAALALARLMKPRQTRQYRTAVLVLIAATLVATFTGAFATRRKAPPGYTPLAYRTWVDVGSWIRENIPADSLLFAPREAFGANWYTDRAQYVCFKDCPQDTPGILEWNSRLWNLHHWSENAYTDQRYEISDTTQLFEKFGITHIVTRKLGPFELEPIYKNKVWRVYDIRPGP